ncbi:MAG: ABC transporter permease [Cyclobacteriaceae bacterium]|nr:ABC transporter permease [Cyclobacteriaceae bacterium]
MSRIIVDARQSKFRINWRELLAYRDLFAVLAYRDLRVRYAQTFLGFTWALLQPLATLTVFVLVFGMAVKVDTGGIPYPLFAISGISMWAYFGFVLNQSGTSIVGAQEMIKKIYFPRLVIPLSKAMVGFVDFGVALMFLVILMVYYQYLPPVQVAFAPLFIILNIMAALAVGIWLSALTIRYRDFQHVVPFIVQFGLYATPVAYPARLVPEKFQLIYNLNPMAGVIQGFRWSIFGGAQPDIYFYISTAVILLLFVTGLIYFRRVESIMADIV